MLWQRNSLKAKYGGVTVGADGPGRAGAFSGGPSPLLGTRLLPSTAGREGPASSQRREPGQLSPQPRHGGRYVSEDFCPWEKGDFPRTEEDGVSAQSPDGDMGGAGTMQRSERWLWTGTLPAPSPWANHRALPASVSPSRSQPPVCVYLCPEPWSLRGLRAQWGRLAGRRRS